MEGDVRLLQQRDPMEFAVRLVIAFLFLPSFAFGQIANAVIANAKVANAYTPAYTAIPVDFLIDFMASGTNLGTLVTLTTATNATRSYVKGPWVYEAGNAPTSNTNMYVWKNSASLPFSYFTDGNSYNLNQTTNCWELTNANYQFLTYQMPIPGPTYSWFFIMKVFESQSSIGYNFCGPEVGGELDWSQWVDDPSTGYWISETIAGGSPHIPAVGMTNIYLYFTGMANTNLGQTLLFMYTNTAADMSGTWGLVGTASNHLVLGPGTGTTLFDIGRMDVHGNVALSKADFIMAGVDTNYAHFPLGPAPWTNAWPPNITGTAVAICPTTAELTWTTDQSANSVINYGTTTAYGSSSTSSSMVRAHDVTISSLTASTTYHYQICSTDGTGLMSCTADSTFTTPSSGNNIALVGSQTFHGGEGNNSSTVVVSTPGNVTSGNDVLVGVTMFQGATPTAGMLTKTAGSATVNAAILDNSQHDSINTLDTAIYRVHVTGSGSLTLTFNSGATPYTVVGGAEFSGLNSSPVSSALNATSSGVAGTTHGFTNDTSCVNGLYFYVAEEFPNANFTRTWSDTVIDHIDTGSGTGTGIIQYKIFSGSPQTVWDKSGTDSEQWIAIAVRYNTQ